jgi:hypothetical protein
LDLAENIFETHFWGFLKEKYPAGHIKATLVLEKSKKKSPRKIVYDFYHTMYKVNK